MSGDLEIKLGDAKGISRTQLVKINEGKIEIKYIFHCK